MRYDMLLGRGRSGTTWIGQILNAYRGCVYKYEPFLLRKNNEYLAWLSALPMDPARIVDPIERARQFERLCGMVHHDVDYPPFPPKSWRSQNPALLRLTWQIGKQLPKLKGVYRWYARPDLQRAQSVLIKDVNFPNEKLASLCTVLGPTIIGVVKNPFASVASAIRFYEDVSKAQNAHTCGRLRELIDLPGYERFRRFRDELQTMSFEAFEALRWCVQTEPLIDFIDGYERAMVLVYEEFCLEPSEMARRLFDFLGWEYDERVDAEIARTTNTSGNWLDRRKGLHSTRRDPVEMMNRWRKHLKPAQIAEIRRVVDDSPALSLWPEFAPARPVPQIWTRPMNPAALQSPR